MMGGLKSAFVRRKVSCADIGLWETRSCEIRRVSELPPKLPPELTQARRFGKTRSAQSGALLEDYAELIADLLATSRRGAPDRCCPSPRRIPRDRYQDDFAVEAGGAGNGAPLSRGVSDGCRTGAGRTDASPSQARREDPCRAGCFHRDCRSRCRGDRASRFRGNAESVRSLPAIAQVRACVPI